VILLLYAHPDHERSIAHRALLSAVANLPNIRHHALYDAYPDFDIDIARERDLLSQARLVIWQHPLFWYSTPALLTLWFERVLQRGWAYGAGGTALAGKDCLWVTSTGGTTEDYSAAGIHGHAFDRFSPPIRQTAEFCGMRWLEPIVLHGAHRVDAAVVAAAGADYRRRLIAWLEAASG
jgi:glutathione-regulated potassium-efflux system ancillary protein KefF